MLPGGLSVGYFRLTVKCCDHCTIPTNSTWFTRPFPCDRVGSGDETKVSFCGMDKLMSLFFPLQEVDGESLLSLNPERMVKLMDLKTGPALRIYNKITALKQQVGLHPL